ncbi:mitochondrial import inner membrane translocase subunit TIM8 [Ricinus communis]|uniref:mitochondrial import inner membrane translocase subunit TIM8 n=1 Tax=Ricinus communis TaxID=3988 RepID=UPI00201A25C9|nr:mitochondrial import inner membrane translocase subunit TIM8 [Ricinus communis]
MDTSALDSAEMQRFLNQEKEKAMVNEMVAKLTSACWDKCITSTPGSKFSSSESSCLTNCAQRYMDMSLIIMKRFQSMH